MKTATTTTAIAESVGALLRQAREESGLSRTAVASRTKIPERYIAQFEEGPTVGAAEDVYTKIYLKAYAKFLGFETATLIELYRNDAQLMSGLQARVMEEQVIDWIAERAQHAEQTLSFSEAIRQ